MKLALSRTILFAKDAARLARFYGETLGLRRLASAYPEHEWVLFDAGAAQLALHRIPEPWNAAVHIEEPAVTRHGSPHKLVFTVDDVAQTRAELLARACHCSGLRGEPAPRDLARCDFVDPEGNVFQISRAD